MIIWNVSFEIDQTESFGQFFNSPPPPRVKTLLWYQQIMSKLQLSAVIGWAHLRIMRSGYKGLEQHEHESITAVTAVGHMFAAGSLVSISRIRLHDFCVIPPPDTSSSCFYSLFLSLFIFICGAAGGCQVKKMSQVFLRRPPTHCTTVISLPTLTSTSKQSLARRAQVCACGALVCLCPRP